MKKSIIVFCLLLMHQIISAQTEKGNIIISAGSDISGIFGKSSYEYSGNSLLTNTNTTIKFEPSAGIFLVKNLAFGLSIPISYTKSYYDTKKEEQKAYGMSPFLMYYFGEQKIKPYVIAELGYMIMQNYSNQSQSVVNDTYGGLVYTGGAGVALFIYDKAALNLELSYGQARLVYDGDSKLILKSNAFGVTLGFTIIL